MSRVRAAAAVCLLALVLGGCGDDEPARDPGDPATPSADGLTPPGTELALGDVATVPLADDSGVIDLVVSSITEGNGAELGQLDGTPYYVRVEATAVSGDTQQFFPAGSLIAFADETLVAPIATPLTVGGCTREQFRTPPLPGTTLKTCLTFVVEPGAAPVDRVAYYEGDYSFNDGTAVEWREP